MHVKQTFSALNYLQVPSTFLKSFPLGPNVCWHSPRLLNPSRNQDLPSSLQSTYASAFQLKIRCLGVGANWTGLCPRAVLELSSLSPLSPPQYAFLRRISLWVGMVYRLPRNLREPLPMGPLASSPPGFIAMDHTLSSPLSPLLIYHALFLFLFFMCLCMYVCMYVHTWAHERYMCICVICMCEKAKVAVSGNVFSSFPFYSFEHFSPLLLWGRAFFFSFIYFTPWLQPSPTSSPPSSSFPFPSSLKALLFLLQPFKSKSTMDVNKTWRINGSGGWVSMITWICVPRTHGKCLVLTSDPNTEKTRIQESLGHPT